MSSNIYNKLLQFVNFNNKQSFKYPYFLTQLIQGDNSYYLLDYVLASKYHRLVLEALLDGIKTTAELANEYDWLNALILKLKRNIK